MPQGSVFEPSLFGILKMSLWFFCHARFSKYGKVNDVFIKDSFINKVINFIGDSYKKELVCSVNIQLTKGMSAFPCRALADTRQIGKLTREQFALAMHLIQQKVSKGIDPPQSLTPEMIPPSERGTPVPVCPTCIAHVY